MTNRLCSVLHFSLECVNKNPSTFTKAFVNASAVSACLFTVFTATANIHQGSQVPPQQLSQHSHVEKISVEKLQSHSSSVKASINNKEVSTYSMADSVQISEAWARATFALAKTGAAYFTLTNTTKQEIMLNSVSVDESVAMMAQLHHTIMQDDMMSMQELEDGITIAPEGLLTLSPGGKHVMIMGLNQPLNSGESIAINLHFEDGSTLLHIFPVLNKRD